MRITTQNDGLLRLVCDTQCEVSSIQALITELGLQQQCCWHTHDRAWSMSTTTYTSIYGLYIKYRETIAVGKPADRQAKQQQPQITEWDRENDSAVAAGYGNAAPAGSRWSSGTGATRRREEATQVQPSLLNQQTQTPIFLDGPGNERNRYAQIRQAPHIATLGPGSSQKGPEKKSPPSSWSPEGGELHTTHKKQKTKSTTTSRRSNGAEPQLLGGTPPQVSTRGSQQDKIVPHGIVVAPVPETKQPAPASIGSQSTYSGYDSYQVLHRKFGLS